MAILDDQVMIGRRYIDVATADFLAVTGMFSVQLSGTIQNLRENAACLWANMKNHEDGGLKVWRQPGCDFLQRFYASDGAANDNDVSLCHVRPPRARQATFCKSSSRMRAHMGPMSYWK